MELIYVLLDTMVDYVNNVIYLITGKMEVILNPLHLNAGLAKSIFIK